MWNQKEAEVFSAGFGGEHVGAQGVRWQLSKERTGCALILSYDQKTFCRNLGNFSTSRPPFLTSVALREPETQEGSLVMPLQRNHWETPLGGPEGRPWSGICTAGLQCALNSLWHDGPNRPVF